MDPDEIEHYWKNYLPEMDFDEFVEYFKNHKDQSDLIKMYKCENNEAP